ncbi:hypothetical protein H4R19_002430 [Coemansia spiralis]|nr:hypothetical protein H4R19_002430 [Coemansia spiralis]
MATDETQPVSSGASPALSTATRRSRPSPMLQRRPSREPKRRSGTAAVLGGTSGAERQQVGGPPVARRARTVAGPPAATSAGGLPLASGVPLSAGAVLEQQQQMSGGAGRGAMHPPAPVLRGAVQHLVHPPEVLGHGIERLLAFHSVLVPGGEERELGFWQAVVADSFCEGGAVRMELGGHTYEMPVATVGRFYHKLFTEGSVVSIHVALNDPRVYRLPGHASTLSFHDVLMTTTYTNGRRVLDAGELRVVFDPAFRIRVWAFLSTDTSVCLPRKRPNGPDDALPRTSEATISRNLDWPNDTRTTPRRRKSAHGRQPPDECALPVCALQHLEISNTMAHLQDLMRVQIQAQTTDNPHPPMGPLELWRATVNPTPLAAHHPQPPRPAAADNRRRQRRRSAIAPAAKNTPDPALITLVSSASPQLPSAPTSAQAEGSPATSTGQ